MITATLDQINRRWLLECSYPIHYYMEGLFHAATCLRELSFDSLKIINSANLPVNSYGAIDLPDDFVDDLAVCISSGQSLNKLPKQDNINPIRRHDTTTGEFVTYTDPASNTPQTFLGLPYWGFSWFWNVNEFSEPTGRFFGARGGTSSGYKVIKERRQIQLTENFAGTNVILLYISDGSSVDNATQIDPQAFATINAFINWKKSPNKDIEYSPEGRTFYNQKRLLRARLDDLTPTDIRNILHQNYTAAIKN